MRADEEMRRRRRQRLLERRAALGRDAPRDLVRAGGMPLSTLSRILSGSSPLERMKGERIEKRAGALRGAPMGGAVPGAPGRDEGTTQGAAHLRHPRPAPGGRCGGGPGPRPVGFLRGNASMEVKR